jgi:hypothetical protein
VRQGKIINGGNGNNYIAVTSGTTGSVAPTLPTALCAAPLSPDAGCSVSDGGVTWQRNWMTGSAKWTMKNLIEFKTANRATIKWNTLDGAWPDGQVGLALSIKAENQASAGDWTARTEHIEFAHNLVRNTAVFALVNSGGDAKDGVTSDINIHNNLVRGFKGATGNPALRTGGRTVPPHLSGLRIVHNTIERSADAVHFWVAGSGAPQYDFPVVTDNLFDMGGTQYPLICFACPSTSMRKAALDNVSVGASYAFARNVVAGENLFSWPTGNFATSWSSIGFTNPAAGNYRLRNGSPHRGAGTDGKDLGADISQLPLIEELTVRPTDRLALFTWRVTEPIQNIPCVMEISAERDLWNTIADFDPARFPRPDTSDHDRLPKDRLSRTMIAGANAALASGTTYWYRLHCGGAFEQGNFTTLPPLSGNSVMSVSKGRRPGLDSFDVQWGAFYSRETDAIGDGGTVEATCTPRDVCSANFQIPSGSIAYYRIRDKGPDGQILNNGAVMVRAATGTGF